MCLRWRGLRHGRKSVPLTSPELTVSRGILWIGVLLIIFFLAGPAFFIIPVSFTEEGFSGLAAKRVFVAIGMSRFCHRRPPIPQQQDARC